MDLCFINDFKFLIVQMWFKQTNSYNYVPGLARTYYHLFIGLKRNNTVQKNFMGGYTIRNSQHFFHFFRNVNICSAKLQAFSAHARDCHVNNNKLKIQDGAMIAEWGDCVNQSMLNVEGSGPGASILKFDIFQFLKWLCLDQNNNFGILVVLLVLNY